VDIYNVFLDRDFRILSIGSFLIEKLRYREEHLKNRSFFEIVFPMDRDSFREFLTQSKSGCICSVRLVDRTDRIVYARVKYHSDEKGYYLKVEIIPSPLEEVDDLKWQLEIHQKGLEMIGAGLIFTDIHGTILYVSRSAERLLKLVSRNIIGKNINEFISSDNIEFITSGDDEIREVKFHYRGKTIYLGYHSDYVSSTDGRIAGYLIAFMEISDLKRLEKEQARIDKLASLGILASGIAHEIRNPLAGIKAMAQTIQSELSESDPNRKYVDRIINQVNRLDKILKAFFAYARPKVPFRTEVNFKEVVGDIDLMLRHQCEKKGVKLKIRVPSDLPDLIVDRDQLQQILINLVLNAIDAVEEGRGVIEIIAAKSKKVPGTASGNRSCRRKDVCGVEIMVKDNGSGIDPGIMDKIFDPFFTTKSKGTGLGLSIVHQLVTENCGEISVESEPGKGTTFHLFFQSRWTKCQNSLLCKCLNFKHKFPASWHKICSKIAKGGVLWRKQGIF